MEALSDQTKDEIREHAREAFPNECCGVIIKLGKKQAVRRCRNESPPPTPLCDIRASSRHNYSTNVEDLRKAEEEGEVVLSYHSHIESSPEPSIGDKADVERKKIPCVIVSWPADTWSFYAPTGWKSPLIGRPFVHGILDCYTIIQDYYEAELSIVLPDFDRDDLWWKKGKNLYLDNFSKVGFREVEGMQLHDIILMQLQSPVPNHAGIYLGDGMMLHHPPSRLSCRMPYVADRGFYATNTYAILRHESFP